MAAAEPEAAFGPPTPAKKIANVTGTVMSAASHVVPLTRVPMISATLPTTARPTWAMNLSLLVPLKDAMTSVANPPNVANRASCGSPMTLKVSANNEGTTTVARTARIAAGTDQTGFHQGCDTLPNPTERPGADARGISRCLQAFYLALRREQCGYRCAQRGHAIGGGGARRGEVLADGLDHLQVGLDLGLGAARADDDPGPRQGVAEHVGRRQTGARIGEVGDRLHRHSPEFRWGSGSQATHDVRRVWDPWR